MVKPAVMGFQHRENGGDRGRGAGGRSCRPGPLLLPGGGDGVCREMVPVDTSFRTVTLGPAEGLVASRFPDDTFRDLMETKDRGFLREGERRRKGRASL